MRIEACTAVGCSAPGREHLPGGTAGRSSGSRRTANDKDLLFLLGDLSDAISVVSVVQRSLETKEVAGRGR